jgi:hypothetical protein
MPAHARLSLTCPEHPFFATLNSMVSQFLDGNKMLVNPWFMAWALLTSVFLSGCSWLSPRLFPATVLPATPNPAFIPPLEDQAVWLQIVDVVDDYFRIQVEQPVQRRAEVMLEGRLETTYRPGASLLEPWRPDSSPGFERWQSTLQSIRRKGIVTVRPRPNGYEVEAIVLKELEDVDRNQESGSASTAIRHDGTVIRTENDLEADQITLGWIPQGRDFALEQRILMDIVGRLSGPITTKP